MAEAPNGLLQAWFKNVQLQFDHMDGSLTELHIKAGKHDERLKTVEICVTKLEVLQNRQNKTSNRHERKIEDIQSQIIKLIREWGPWIAVGILFAKDLIK